MLNEDIAYFAGLFEGEGWITPKKGSNGWRLGINMTDLYPLQRAESLYGGKIHGPYDRSKYGSIKPIYSWTVHGYYAVESIYIGIKDYLSPRRQKQFEVSLSIKPKALQGCGTYGGYQRHKRRKEEACRPCLDANRDYRRRK